MTREDPEPEAECRICFEGGPGLVSPCLCRGSQRYVHLSCLERAVRAQRRWDHLKCMSCHSGFDGPAGVHLGEVALQEAEREHESELVLAVLSFNLATACGRVGNARRKRDLLERVLEIEERHYGRDHEYVAATLNNLANAYFSAGDPEGAKPLLQRSLAIKEQIHGRDHPGFVLTQNNLANAYRLTGELCEAKDLLEQVLQDEVQRFGQRHVKVAMVKNNLASVHCRLGNPEAATELLRCALQVEEQYYGPTHCEVGCTLVNLALAEALIGQWAAADEHCMRGVACLRPCVNEYTVNGLTCAGVVRCACGAQEQGRQLVQEALACSREAGLGKKPVETELCEAALCFGVGTHVHCWVQELQLPD